MTFQEWWYDYRVKNQIGESTVKREIARDAWDAAVRASANAAAMHASDCAHFGDKEKGATANNVSVIIKGLFTGFEKL